MDTRDRDERESTRPRELGNAETRDSWGRPSASPCDHPPPIALSSPLPSPLPLPFQEEMLKTFKLIWPSMVHALREVSPELTVYQFLQLIEAEYGKEFNMLLT